MACRTALIVATAFIITLAALLAAPSARAQGTGEPTGVWQTQAGDARVKISKCGGGICGVIVSLKEPIDPATGKPQVDDKNPNPGAEEAADDRPAAVQRHAAERRPTNGRARSTTPMTAALREQRFGGGPGYAAGGRMRRRALRRRDLDAGRTVGDHLDARPRPEERKALRRMSGTSRYIEAGPVRRVARPVALTWIHA